MIEPKKELKKHKITNKKEVGVPSGVFTFIRTAECITNVEVPRSIFVVPQPRKEKWYKKFFKKFYHIPKNIFKFFLENYPIFLTSLISAILTTGISLLTIGYNMFSFLTFLGSYVVFLIENAFNRENGN